MLVGQYPQQQMNAPGYPPRRSPQAPSNIRCYRCTGDHLVKDCPEPPPPRRLPLVDRFCDGCCLEHLPKDCPTRLSSAHATEAKASINYIEVIPSPHEDEAEADRRSLNVITRSQSKKKMTTLENKEPQTETPVKKKRGRKGENQRKRVRILLMNFFNVF